MRLPQQNDKGQERKVGVELEFSGIPLDEISQTIVDCYGGKTHKENKSVFQIETDTFGKFKAEVDARVVKKISESAESANQENLPQIAELLEEAGAFLRDMGVPIEVVTPPIPISKLSELDVLVERLRNKGAVGTKASYLYAFGLHLNPEVVSLESESILAYMQSFMLCYDWLVEALDIDVTRKVFPFIRPFPRSYAMKILQSHYQPDISNLIEDYLKDNPTRNRALDMLPLFSYIEEDLVHAYVESDLIKARPTFHYRMPNCKIDDPEWSIGREWEYWCVVEHLAQDQQKREALARKYIDYFGGKTTVGSPVEWINIFKVYLNV